MKHLNENIDHTLLRPDATLEEILKACAEAVEHHFYGLCIDRKWLSKVVPQLRAGGVKAVTVVGFPAGDDSTSAKVEQTQQAIGGGADEIDMVLNRGLLKERDYAAVFQDIQAVVKASNGNWVKVILETSELEDGEIIAACALSVAAGAKFVKTSTGFSRHGATVEAVRLMRQTVGYHVGVKASGGIRDRQTALEMIAAGATRLGTSASVTIMDGHHSSDSGY
jgi:deoxyribose-phosphate aldolase